MTSAIEMAFQAVPRQHFLPKQLIDQASRDAPLPIGHGQTNSQPYTVQLMLEWLDARSGQKVLDVGSGSGWTTALLAHLVGSKGRVIAVERVPELVEFGRQNCERFDLSHVEFHQAGDVYGWPDGAPYDRILVSAAAENVPAELMNQLKPGGRLVIPVKNSIFVVDKDKDGNLHQSGHPGFSFVPLI